MKMYGAIADEVTRMGVACGQPAIATAVGFPAGAAGGTQYEVNEERLLTLLVLHADFVGTRPVPAPVPAPPDLGAIATDMARRLANG